MQNKQKVETQKDNKIEKKSTILSDKEYKASLRAQGGWNGSWEESSVGSSVRAAYRPNYRPNNPGGGK
jgi:hypothetical protein